MSLTTGTSAMGAESALLQFTRRVGVEEGPGPWMHVDHGRIAAFADATLDHQFIHVDATRARLTPFGGTVAHGFLTLSLVPHLMSGIAIPSDEAAGDVRMAVNYGADRVRFPNPVRADSHIRARRKLLRVARKDSTTIQLTHEVTVEIQGQTKPACVAEIVTLLFYNA